MSRSLRPVLLAPLVLVVLSATACGGDDGRSAAAPVATAPEGSSPTTPPASTPPVEGVVDTTPGGQKASVLAVLSGVEACWGTTQSYARCDTPQVVRARGAHLVTDKRPGPGEVAVTAASRDTFKIVGTDLAGTRYVLSKDRSGGIKRTCRLATGETCPLATW